MSTESSAADFEVPGVWAASPIRNFKSKGGAAIMILLAPMLSEVREGER
jgi:hypothetical protein